MSRFRQPTLLERLRNSSALRVFFAVTGLFWMVSATACAIHDVSGDCDYTQSVLVSPHGDAGDDDGADHVPCCPHPLSIQLLVFQAEIPAKTFIVTGSAPMPAFLQPYRSYLQSPPTPPPIAG
jgi:hypothetical protein